MRPGGIEPDGMRPDGIEPDRHFGRDDLIDFVDGDVTPERRDEISAHLEICSACRGYVESLRRTFAAIAVDKVPEPPPGYWDYFEQRVRLRAGQAAGAEGPAPQGSVLARADRRRRLFFSWASGIVAAAALVILLWWLPQPTTRGIGAPGPGMPGAEAAQVDPVDVILADLSTEEILESLAASPSVSLMLIETDPEDITRMDAYLSETGSIYDLVDELNEEEMQIFMSSLKATMEEEDNTSGINDGREGKGC